MCIAVRGEIIQECDGKPSETQRLENSACISFEMSEDSDEFTMLITVDDETYAVSGTCTSKDGGELTITDSEGEWNCTFNAEGQGCCQSEGRPDININDECL